MVPAACAGCAGATAVATGIIGADRAGSTGIATGAGRTESSKARASGIGATLAMVLMNAADSWAVGKGAGDSKTPRSDLHCSQNKAPSSLANWQKGHLSSALVLRNKHFQVSADPMQL